MDTSPHPVVCALTYSTAKIRSQFETWVKLVFSTDTVADMPGKIPSFRNGSKKNVG